MTICARCGPLFATPRTFQRTIYRLGDMCQFDIWQPSREIAVGHGQTRKGYVVVAVLGYSRVGAGALVFSKEAEDLLWGITRGLRSFGGLPGTLVWGLRGRSPADPPGSTTLTERARAPRRLARLGLQITTRSVRQARPHDPPPSRRHPRRNPQSTTDASKASTAASA
jgi:hypothetical protein